MGFCRNLGMRISNSKYISFLDSDDYWELNKLEKQIYFMETFNYDFTYTDYLDEFNLTELEYTEKDTKIKVSKNNISIGNQNIPISKYPKNPNT